MRTALSPAALYEWRRCTSARSTKWLLGLVVLAGVIAGVQNLVSDSSGSFLSGAVGHASQVGLLAAALGALAIGPEFRWNTIRQLFITFPRRYDSLAAKVGVVVGLVAAASLLASVVGGALGFAHRSAAESVLDWLDLSVRAVLVLAGWTIIGFAIAGLARSTVVGVAVPLVFAYLFETIVIQTIQSETLANVLPFYNASQAVSVQRSTGEAYEHLAVFGIWVLICLGACTFVLGRRDA